MNILTANEADEKAMKWYNEQSDIMKADMISEFCTNCCDIASGLPDSVYKNYYDTWIKDDIVVAGHFWRFYTVEGRIQHMEEEAEDYRNAQ